MGNFIDSKKLLQIKKKYIYREIIIMVEEKEFLNIV